jgi:A20-like zinc finger
MADQSQTAANTPSETKLCKNGCGFFVSTENRGVFSSKVGFGEIGRSEIFALLARARVAEALGRRRLLAILVNSMHIIVLLVVAFSKT